MDLVPRKPFRELSSLRHEMDNLWNRFFDESPFGERKTREWLPSVDISETNDKLLVKAELPGLDSKDISVTMAGDMLTIKGEKKKESEEKDEHHHCIERYCGSFQRVFRLPAGVQADKVSASFKKGVLKIELPKTEESKKKQIEIKIKE